MAAPGEKPLASAPAPKGLQLKVAEKQPKPGGAPLVKLPGVEPKGTPAAKKKRKLSPVMTAAVVILLFALGIGGYFSYKIYFPPPPPVVVLNLHPHPKPKPEATPEPRPVVVAEAPKPQPREVPTPTPAVQSVMVQTNLSADVKVNNTQIEAANAASPEFRAFVANANVGGVFQGHPSRALINGIIVREGQIVDSTLAIEFERADPDNKMIYFKDSTGAEVSKSY